MRVVTFKLPDDLLEELDRYALSAGVSRSEVIRDAIMVYLRSRVRSRPCKFRVRRVVLY